MICGLIYVHVSVIVNLLQELEREHWQLLIPSSDGTCRVLYSC